MLVVKDNKRLDEETRLIKILVFKTVKILHMGMGNYRWSDLTEHVNGLGGHKVPSAHNCLLDALVVTFYLSSSSIL
jgi:hypothetical protein